MIKTCLCFTPPVSFPVSCSPTAQARCKVSFPGLHLAFCFLLKQPVPKLTITSVCMGPVQAVSITGCSHQVIFGCCEQLSLNLQAPGVSEIHHSGTCRASPALLPYQHQASSALYSGWEYLLMQDISSARMRVAENQ